MPYNSEHIDLPTPQPDAVTLPHSVHTFASENHDLNPLYIPESYSPFWFDNISLMHAYYYYCVLSLLSCFISKFQCPLYPPCFARQCRPSTPTFAIPLFTSHETIFYIMLIETPMLIKNWYYLYTFVHIFSSLNAVKAPLFICGYK